MDYDVCIIGAGLTGLLTARTALAAGKSVVMIERGGEYRPKENRGTWWSEDVSGHPIDDEFSLYQNVTRESFRFSDLVRNESNGFPWAFQYNMRYGIGGSSDVWSGMAWRLTPDDFRTKSIFGYGHDWPISYDEVAPYYDRAEELMEVSGPKGDLLKTFPYWPWKNSFSYPHFPLSYLDNKFQDIIGDIGQLVPQPHAVRNKPADEGGCVGAKTCVSICAAKAIFKGSDRLLPQIIFESNLEIISETAVIRIHWDDEKITGVTCRPASGDEDFEVTAATYFLCGNGFENIRLIKWSEVQNGRPFGASSPHVGVGFGSHAAITYTVKTDENVYPVRGRPTHASIIEWVQRPGNARYGGITLEVWNSEFMLGYAPWEQFDKHVKNGHWGGHLFNLLGEFERQFCVSMVFETEMHDGNTLTLSEERKDRFGIPLGRTSLHSTEVDARTLAKAEAKIDEIRQRAGLTSVTENGRGINGNHPLGGLRMSSDPSRGVVNGRCRSHDFSNLYIFGGSAFCSTGSFNPTLTIVALTLRALEDPELGWTQ